MKESLHAMLLQCVGLGNRDKDQVRWFNLAIENSVEYLIYVNALRVDFASNSVVLDVAVLIPSFEHQDFMHSPIADNLFQKCMQIAINKNEREAWRQMLPAACEVCRTNWKHNRATCAYYKPGCTG